MEETSAESRRRILDAAEELFAERGFIETSLADVAERSGISRGSIPWHFDNKIGLLMAVVDRAAERAGATPITPGFDDLHSSILEIGQRLREPHMALLHMLLGEASKPDSAIRSAYAAHHERDRTAVQSWLAESPGVEVDGIDAQDLSALIYSLIIGINVQWRISPDRVNLDKTLAAMGSLLIAAIGSAD
ncbi:MAG: TetR/AcrR family transcriptional regulator [Ilumatobacter sp.]